MSGVAGSSPGRGSHTGWGWEGGVEGEPEGGRAGGTPGALPPSEIKHLASGIFGPSRRISHKGGVLPRKPTRESPAPHQEQGPPHDAAGNHSSPLAPQPPSHRPLLTFTPSPLASRPLSSSLSATTQTPQGLATPTLILGYLPDLWKGDPLLRLCPWWPNSVCETPDP